MRRLLISVSLALATIAEAQTVSGRVTDRTSAFPVAGVVVSGLDARGALLVRAITDSANGYRLSLVPGIEKLQFRRIGYSPAEVALKDSVAGRIDVILARLPTQLPPVKATIAAQCSSRADADDALALWDQARSGMLTSIVARESKTAWISILSYSTSFDGDDEEPRSVNRVEFDSASNAFFAGGKPAELATSGYGIVNLFGATFLGPDDGVLFDESFLGTHCFSLGEATDSTLELNFEPAKGRNKLIEIGGTVLFRRNPLELKSVTYQYTGVPSPLDKARPGGAIHFERMPSGITMIQRWHIRGAFPVMGPQTTSGGRTGVVTGRTGVTRGGASSGQIQVPVRSRGVSVQATETGAMIELMQWPNVPPFVATMAAISGTLTDKNTKKPLANAPVLFYRTPYRTTTDSVGHFSLVDVLPGVYEIDTGDPLFELYGMAPDLIGPIAIKYGSNDLELTGEGPEAVVARGCGDKVDGRVDMPKQLAGKNAIFGMITPLTRPPSQIGFQAEILLAGSVPGTPPFPLKGKTDKLGRFRLCGLPAGSVRISAGLGALTGSQAVATDPEHPYQLITLKLAKPGGP